MQAPRCQTCLKLRRSKNLGPMRQDQNTVEPRRGGRGRGTCMSRWLRWQPQKSRRLKPQLKLRSARRAMLLYRRKKPRHRARGDLFCTTCRAFRSGPGRSSGSSKRGVSCASSDPIEPGARCRRSASTESGVYCRRGNPTEPATYGTSDAAESSGVCHRSGVSIGTRLLL